MEYFEYPLLQRCERWVNEFNADTEPIPFYQFIASGILVNFIGLSMLLHLFYPCTRYNIREEKIMR